MLQHSRSGDRPFLRDMSYDKECDARFFGQTQQHRGRFPDLGDASGCGLNVIAVHCLYRIDHNDLRLTSEYDIGDRPEAGLAQKLQCVRRTPDPHGAELDLAKRLFSGNIQNRNSCSGHMARRLQKDRGFSDARISAEQNQ